MSLDGLAIRSLAKTLKKQLCTGKVDKIAQPNPQTLESPEKINAYLPPSVLKMLVSFSVKNVFKIQKPLHFLLWCYVNICKTLKSLISINLIMSV